MRFFIGKGSGCKVRRLRARMHSAGILRAFEIDAKTNAFAQILNAFIVKGIVSKGKSDIKSRLGGIRGLWKHGISGDRRSCSCALLVRSS